MPSKDIGQSPADNDKPVLTATPLMDLVEQDDGLRLYCTLPGVAPGGAAVTMDGEFLSVRAESRLAPIRGKVHALEFCDIVYEGKIRLPTVDISRIEASIANGLLCVFLPFPPKKPPLRIPVSAG